VRNRIVMTADTTAILSKTLGLVWKPIRFCWDLFRDQLLLRVEFPQYNGVDSDRWPVPTGSSGVGAAEFTLINSASHEIELSCIRVCFAPPLQIKPLPTDTFFAEAQPSGIIGLPFCVVWKASSSSCLTMAPRSQLGLRVCHKITTSQKG
jgi:hypothetical protein